MDPLSFLATVWSKQPDGYFFLAYFDEAHTFHEQHYLRKTAAMPAIDLTKVGNGVDLYFCPTSFTKPQRRNVHAQQSRWLYADLDEVDPTTLRRTPTLSWRTSPGRYQCAWLLGSPLGPDEHALTNKYMTYSTKADKGGWSLTKLLRVPGSVSHKRAKPARVALLTGSSLRRPAPVYRSSTLYRRAKRARTSEDSSKQPVESAAAADILRKYGTAIPAGARKTLRTKPDSVVGDRSVILWKLENQLLKAGLNIGEVLVLVKACSYNKYKGQDREEAQLWKEITRAAEQLGDVEPAKPAAKKKPQVKKPANTAARMKRLKRQRTRAAVKRAEERVASDSDNPGTFNGCLGVPYQEWMKSPYPQPSWLIDGIWPRGTTGVVSGVWKGYKSTLLLDMAISVSTGSKCLSRYNVSGGPKPVLYLHEEGHPGHVQIMVARIGYSHGMKLTAREYRNGHRVKPRRGELSPDTELELKFPNAPLHISSFPKIDLTTKESLDLLQDSILLNGYEMVILESFYLMTGDADEKASEQVTPVLKAIEEISENTGAAIIISHHFNKTANPDRRALDRISGTGVFARWLNNGVFLERVGKEQDSVVKLEVHGRMYATPPPVYIKFSWPDRPASGDPSDPRNHTGNYESGYIVEVTDKPPAGIGATFDEEGDETIEQERKLKKKPKPKTPSLAEQGREIIANALADAQWNPSQPVYDDLEKVGVNQSYARKLAKGMGVVTRKQGTEWKLVA